MQLMQLGAFFAAALVLVVCGCTFTRKPAKNQQSPAESGKTEIAEPPIGA
jgi:hypothetical protein